MQLFRNIQVSPVLLARRLYDLCSLREPVYSPIVKQSNTLRKCSVIGLFAFFSFSLAVSPPRGVRIAAYKYWSVACRRLVLQQTQSLYNYFATFQFTLVHCLTDSMIFAHLGNLSTVRVRQSYLRRKCSMIGLFAKQNN